MFVLLTLVGLGYGALTSPPPGCEVTSYPVYGPSPKGPDIFEVSASVGPSRPSVGSLDPKTYYFTPNYDLQANVPTGKFAKFLSKKEKAVSIITPIGMGEPEAKNIMEGLYAQIHSPAKWWGYIFHAGSSLRIVIVFKPTKKLDYTGVLNHALGVDVWDVEKSYFVHSLPKPLWVLAKPGSVTSDCDQDYNRQEKDDAKDEEDIKETKMYKKFSEMTKKKLMKLMKKYQEKIAIAKKALKAMKKDKEN